MSHNFGPPQGPLWETFRDFTPSDEYDVSPCLVIVAGRRAAAHFDEMREAICPWIRSSFPYEAVRWGVAIERQEVTSKWARALIEPLLSNELQTLLYERGYIRDPAKGSSIRAYIVLQPYDLVDPRQEPDAGELLSDIIEAIDREMSRQGDPKLNGQTRERWVLILLLPPFAQLPGGLPLDMVNSCLVITPRQANGIGFPTENYDKIYDVARIALHALIASEAGRIVREAGEHLRSRGQAPIFAVGSSAISTAITHMRDYRVAKVLSLLLHPYLGSPRENSLLVGWDEGSPSVGGWEEFARSLLDKAGWWERTYEGLKIWPDPESQLGKRLGKSPDLAYDEAFIQELSRALFSLQREFKKEAMEEGKKRADGIAEGIADQIRRAVFQNTDVGLLHKALSTLEGYISLLLESQNTFAIKLRELLGGDILGPTYASDLRGWHAHARVAASRIRLISLALERAKGQTASPLQIAVRVFPLWPLLALLLQAFAEMNAWMTWLVGLVIALIIGVAGHFWWQKRLDKWASVVARERNKQIQPLVTGIAYLWSQEGQEALKQRLTILGEETRLLMKYLEIEHQECIGVMEAIAQAAESDSASHLLEYELYDLDFCNQWAERAIRARGEDVSLQERLLEIICSTVRGKLLAQGAVNQVRRLVERVVEEALAPPEMAAIELAGRVPALEKGRKWSWLYRHAVPRGWGDTNDELVIVATSSSTDLMGEAGKHAPEWGECWIIARSRQPHRITMLRLIPYKPS